MLVVGRVANLTLEPTVLPFLKDTFKKKKTVSSLIYLELVENSDISKLWIMQINEIQITKLYNFVIFFF